MTLRRRDQRFGLVLALLLSVTVMFAPVALAHHKDGHSDGPSSEQGGGSEREAALASVVPAALLFGLALYVAYLMVRPDLDLARAALPVSGTIRSFRPFPRTFACSPSRSTSAQSSPCSSERRMPVP
mgnify:CR=1 FL=1